MINLAQLSRELGCNVMDNELLSQHTTFKTGGSARLFIEVNTELALSALLKYIDDNKIKYFLLGNGSNVLAPDEGFNGVVLCLKGDFCNIQMTGDSTVYCGAGVSLAKCCKFALDNALSGFEFAWGIPGTLGGAVYMNAGAYISEIKNIITSCRYMTYDGKISEFAVYDMDLSYRHSIFHNFRAVILGATFKLNLSNKESIKSLMDDFMQRRKSKQPLEYPSAGSTFKRPVGYFAGAVIEECGLKGYAVGGAEVSTKHSGFVINKANATSNDIKTLIQNVQDIVYTQTGLKLEREVIYM